MEVVIGYILGILILALEIFACIAAIGGLSWLAYEMFHIDKD